MRIGFFQWGAYAPCLLSLISLFAAGNGSQAQTIWSGFTKSFTKADEVDGSLAANQDKITPNVRIAREFTGGLYNGVTEDFYNTTSPADTEWATALIPDNASKTVAATNWQALTFANWTTAYQGHLHDGMLPSNLLGNNAVVHLITDNIYLDLEFTSWSAFGVGGFSYMRAEAPTVPITTGDYNRNHIVDAADYTVWRDTLGQMVPNGTGADGNADGTINTGDYDFWKTNFGNPAPGAGSGANSSAAVPEPATIVLATFALIAGFLIRLRHRLQTGFLTLTTLGETIDCFGAINDTRSWPGQDYPGQQQTWNTP